MADDENKPVNEDDSKTADGPTTKPKDTEAKRPRDRAKRMEKLKSMVRTAWSVHIKRVLGRMIDVVEKTVECPDLEKLLADNAVFILEEGAAAKRKKKADDAKAAGQTKLKPKPKSKAERKTNDGPKKPVIQKKKPTVKPIPKMPVPINNDDDDDEADAEDIAGNDDADRKAVERENAADVETAEDRAFVAASDEDDEPAADDDDAKPKKRRRKPEPAIDDDSKPAGPRKRKRIRTASMSPESVPVASSVLLPPALNIPFIMNRLPIPVRPAVDQSMIL